MLSAFMQVSICLKRMNNDKTSLIFNIRVATLNMWQCFDKTGARRFIFGCWPTLKKAVNERTDSKKERKKIRNKKMKRKTEREKERKKKRVINMKIGKGQESARRGF